MNEGVTIDFKVHFRTGRAGLRQLHSGGEPIAATAGQGKIPRIARLMALAIRFDELVRSGEVEDFAAIAELGQVSRARVSQIVNLLNLAPDIQEEILFSPPVQGDRDAISEREVREIAAEVDWQLQREAWSKARQDAGGSSGPSLRGQYRRI